MDVETLRRRLPVGGLGEPLEFHHQVGSTNDRAHALAAQGAPHGALVVAEEQTAGRGRAGRRWYTPPGAALALSLVLRPPALKPTQAAALPALGALAVAEALEAAGVRAEIKWPNDVLLAGRKVAGVLAEAVWEGAGLAYAVLGIGVNVRPQAVPPEDRLDFPATCVEAVVGQPVERAGLLVAVVAGVARWLPRLGEADLRQAWEARLAFRGQEVAVTGALGSLRGRVVGLADDGRLRLETEGGPVLVGFGEVHLRPIDRTDE